MKIHRTYKVELDPNNHQRTTSLRHAGVARWAYNWGLSRKQAVYQQTKKTPSYVDLHKELVQLKKTPQEEGGVPWMYEVSKCAPLQALRNLDHAYSEFFRRLKSGVKGKKGFPKYKSKKNGIGSFYLQGIIKPSQDGRSIQLPRLGSIRLKEHGYIPQPTENRRILSATVSEKAGRWFVSVQFEEILPDVKPPMDHIIGVDVGIKNLATTSDGVYFPNPKPLDTLQSQMRRLQKKFSRSKKGSNNRRKVASKISRLHHRISCIRRDSIHKMTTTITKSASIIVVETLNVAGMMKNHSLARSVSDSAFGEILRQLEYKSKWRGVTLIKAHRFFPSSKTCSSCGAVKSDLTLDDRIYSCQTCGLVEDRDMNAALNLKNLGLRQCREPATTESSNTPGSGGRACGEDVRPEVSEMGSKADFVEAGTELRSIPS